MITILKFLDGDIGRTVMVFFTVVAIGISLGAFINVEEKKDIKSVLKHLGKLFIIVELCDLIWLVYYFYNGEYFYNVLKNMVILLILPSTISCINLIYIRRGSRKVELNEKDKIFFVRSLSLISILIILIFLYNFFKLILYTNDILFRGWVEQLYFLLGWLSVFLPIILINYFLYKVMKKSRSQKVITVLTTVVSVIIIPILLFGMVFAYAFTSFSEHRVYEHNRDLIARVESIGMHHTEVTYYEPINFLVMKKSDIESEMYDGSYDRYDRIE